jgi:hypothetical protein
VGNGKAATHIRKTMLISRNTWWERLICVYIWWWLAQRMPIMKKLRA